MAIYQIKTENEIITYMNGTMLFKIWLKPHVYGIIFDKKARGNFPLLTKLDKEIINSRL